MARQEKQLVKQFAGAQSELAKGADKGTVTAGLTAKCREAIAGGMTSQEAVAVVRERLDKLTGAEPAAWVPVLVAVGKELGVQFERSTSGGWDSRPLDGSPSTASGSAPAPAAPAAPAAGSSSTAQARKEKAAAFAAEQKKADKKSSLIEKAILPLSAVLVIVAVVIFFVKRGGGGGDDFYKAIDGIGNSPAISGCADSGLTNDKIDDQPVLAAGAKGTYATVPPSGGPHLAQPVEVNADAFYAADGRPPVEGLVANLVAGWTVIWYDSTSLNAVGPDQVDLLKKAVKTLHATKAYEKIVASEWDKAYGNLPAGAPIALVRQTGSGAQTVGHRSFCHEVSAEALRQFMVFENDPRLGTGSQ